MRLGELVTADPELELLAEVQTSIVAFRLRPSGPTGRTVEADEAALDALNRELPAAVQRRGRAFLTGARLDGREILRACLLNPATTEEDLAVLLAEVKAAGLAHTG